MPILLSIKEDLSPTEADPLAVCPISSVMTLDGAHHTSTRGDEDSKDGIIFDARRLQAKRKAILAMGEAVTGAPNVVNRVQTRRRFSCLLSSISLSPAAIVVIPDDDAQQSEGIGGALKQPIVPVQIAFSFPFNPSPSKDPCDPGQTPVYPAKGFGKSSSGPSPSAPPWNLHNESRLSVRANALEFSRHAFPPTPLLTWNLWVVLPFPTA